MQMPIDETQLLQTMEGAVYSVLKELQVNPFASDYDDYVQMGRILLLDVCRTFEGDPLGNERYQFVAYFKQRFRWFMLDTFRREERNKWLTEDPSSMAVISVQDTYEDGLVADCLSQLPMELHDLFLALYWDQPTKTELAQQMGISRKTLYQRIHRIRTHLKDWGNTSTD